MVNFMYSDSLISIILAVKNADRCVERAINSIINQTYKNIQIVVIDGGSNDKTLKIISKYKSRIDKLVSEPDDGIPDAYNKGIKLCAGEWIYFLNADDLFFSETILEQIFSDVQIDVTVQIISGAVISTSGQRFFGKFNWLLLLKNNVHHQGLFYRSAVLNKYPYNTQYKFYGHDNEHNLLMWKKNIVVKYIDINVALWATGGISDTPKWENYKKEFLARKNVFGYLYYITNIFTVVRFLLKKYLKSISSSDSTA